VQKSLSAATSSHITRVSVTRKSNYRGVLLYTCSENQHVQCHCVVKQLIPKKSLLSMYEMRFPEIYILAKFRKLPQVFSEIDNW